MFSEFGGIYQDCSEHNFQFFFLIVFFCCWEFLFGNDICNVLVAVFVIQELTEVINWKQLFAVEFCVAQKLSRAESWAQPLPFSGKQKTSLDQASDRAGVYFTHSETGLFEVLRRCRVTHNNDVFCSGRSWLLSHYPPSCGWHLWGRVVLMGWVLTPQLCNAASLLLIWSLVRGSDKPLIKIAIEVPQYEMKPCFVNLIVWPTIISPLSCPTGCAILLLQKNHRKIFIVRFFTVFCYVLQQLEWNCFLLEAWILAANESRYTVWWKVWCWFRN